MENTQLPPKTPISYLQELCARKGITPKYDLMSIEGAVHEPTFVYRVTVGEMTATGAGQSKKKAKHTAAKAVLEAILSGQSSLARIQPQQQQQLPVAVNDEVQDTEVTSVLSQYDGGIPGNPVGSLQEFCMSRRWPPPTYEVVEEHGLPHERMFTMACTVKKYFEKGGGKSKKLAKRQTAFNMLQRLKEIPGKPEHPNILDDDEDECFTSGVRDNKIPSLTPMVSQKISHFYKNMKQSRGPVLDLLHDSAIPILGPSCIHLLQEIANEHKFDVIYVELEETSKSGKHQSLVQLSTLPVAVCHGSGETPSEAQTNAAENALSYLKIMTQE